MTDIPEDVMKAAADCYDALPLVYDGWDEDEVRTGIAEAILAERERCASVADDEKEMRQRLYRENAAPLNAHKAEQAEAIADAIRRGRADAKEVAEKHRPAVVAVLRETHRWNAAQWEAFDRGEAVE